MIHNDIQNQLQLLIKTSAPPLIDVAEHAVSTPQWTPGQQIPAHVLASLPNGRFQVQVGDQILDLNLPRNTQPGDQLELTYVSNTPRLTFALLREVPGAAPANVPVALSETAKLIGNLLQGSASVPAVPPAQAAPSALPAQAVAAMQTTASGAGAGVMASLPGSLPTPAPSTAPVLAAPQLLGAAQLDVAAFAQALRGALSQSGLFYEAHQVQWLSGERNLASLRQEPQGQLPPLQAQNPPAVALSQPMISTPEVVAGSPPPLSVLGDRGAVEAGVHPQSVPLVQQQLQALDTRQVIWQGQVWPGQQMQWEIEEEGGRQQGASDDQAATWHTRLNLQLPVLGGINAKLAFVNGAVQLDIATDSADSAAMMRQRQSELAERFSVSGLQLQGVSIQHG